jgi:hypothetical protein
VPVTPLGAARLPDGGCLFTAEGGQRWRSATFKQVGSRVTCMGPAEASAAVAPEELTSMVQRDGGSWLYVGETGALYEAGDPLAPFSRTVPAPEPLAKVAGVGSAVMGATQDGRLLRWEPATGWRAAPPSPTLSRARIFDVASVPHDPQGEGAARTPSRVLALAFPEALFASEDGGLTWKAAGAPPVGARRLGNTAAGELGAQGIFESVVWRGGGFVRAPDKIVAPAAMLAVEVGRAPTVAAVQGARAVLEGDRYYEITRPENEGESWLLSRGRVEGRITTTQPLPDSGGCGSVRVGARGNVVYLACVHGDGSEITADVRRSADAGATWSEPLPLLTPDTDQITISVSSEGVALVAGVCRSGDAPGASGSTCKPGAPILVRDISGGVDGGSAGQDAGRPRASGAPPHGTAPPRPVLQAFPSSAPQLSGPGLNPCFGADPRAAYLIGRRGKDDRVSLFVSHDGGETFSPRTFQPSVVARPARRPEGEDESAEGDAAETFELDETNAPHPGDDGTVGLLVIRSRGGSAYLTTDDDGRVLSVAGPPVDDEGNAVDVIFAGFGRRVLAVPAYLGGEGTSGVLWESLDGGATWDRQGMPQALVREYTHGNVGVVCAGGGCLMGDTVARVGWGSGGDAGAADRPPDPQADPARAVLTPLVCDLLPASRWARVDDVVVPEDAASALPGVRNLVRGRSVWSALTLDRATGALASVSATLPESGEGEARVVRRPLLGPRGAHVATAVSATQVEGYAVIRAAYAPDAQGQPKVGAPLRNVELAWENFLEGTSARARVADAGPLQKADVQVIPGGLDLLRTAMISISSHGLFVRVHAAQVQAGDEIFVDPAGRVERYASAPWPTTGPLGALDFRSDAAAIGGQLLGLGLLQDPDQEWGAVALARRAPGGGWTYAAFGLLPNRAASPLLADTTWGSSSKVPVGVTALLVDPQHGRAFASFVGFRGDGTFLSPEPVPTAFDLGQKPRACTPAERSGTPRAVMLFHSHGHVLFPGQRHPVLVFEPRPKNAVGVAEPEVLLTSSAVIHGTPASPCVGAFEADSAVRGNPIGAVIAGDPARSWLFRAGDLPRPGGKHGEVTTALEYRPMSCRYDDTARIPDAVWSQEGTARP